MRLIHGSFPALTGRRREAACPFHSSLPDGVMVAQATLTRLVMVRIHVGQPGDAGSEHRLLMAPIRETSLSGFQEAICLRRSLRYTRPLSLELS